MTPPTNIFSRCKEPLHVPSFRHPSPIPSSVSTLLSALPLGPFLFSGAHSIDISSNANLKAFLLGIAVARSVGRSSDRPIFCELG